MGFKAAWTACKGKSLDRMVADLRLKRTGAVESEPEAEFCGLTLPGDWSLVLNNFGDGGKVLSPSRSSGCGPAAKASAPTSTTPR